MVVVMRQFGTALGEPLPHDGEYLQDFDFEAFDGVGKITLTPDVQKAMKFADTAEAFAFYRTIPKCRPLRADGKPNRPLTAANWEFGPLPDAPPIQPEKDRK